MAGIGSVGSTERRDRSRETEVSETSKKEDPSATRLTMVRHADARLAEFAGSSKPADVFSQAPQTKPTSQTLANTSKEVNAAQAAVESAPTTEARTAATLRLHELQSKWVAQAKSLGYSEPREFSLTRSTDAELANAHAWLVKGNVIPQDELRRDGGVSYRQNVEASMSLRMPTANSPPFESFPPAVQKRVLESELAKLGVRCQDGETVTSLRDKYIAAAAEANRKGIEAQTKNDPNDVATRQRQGRALAMGLDGRVMSEEDLEQYEMAEATKTLTGGTTLGSAMAIGTAIAGGNTEQMRQGSEMGNMLMEPGAEARTHHLTQRHGGGH